MDIKSALITVLDQVDYTSRACRPNEMVGAVLPIQVIQLARQAIQDSSANQPNQKSTNFKSVKSMYKKFMLVDGDDYGTPHLISDEKAIFRLKALSEELTELEEGYKEMDLEKIADALVDLVVFALGTAVIHNLPWEDLFNDVQRANMSKVPMFTSKKARNGSGSMDLVKPDGWVGPKTAEILKKYGWRGPV